MPAFKFESNMPIILLIIVIVLLSLYFYLEFKKIKLQFEDLTNKNSMIIKEIDNIHLQLHKFFSKMPQSIVPRNINAKIPKSNNNIINKVNPKISKSSDNIINNEIPKINSNNDLKDNVKEIQSNDFNNKEPIKNNNIFGNINDNDNNNNNNIIIPDLIPINYKEDDEVSEVNDTESDNNKSDNDESDDNESENELNMDDLSELSDEDNNKLEEYMKLSVKELKNKCTEMNLHHSGNKSSLAKRIVENL